MHSSKFLLLAIAITLFFSNCKPPSNLTETKTSIELPISNDYSLQWKKIKSLEEKGLTKSILQELDDLLLVAEKENNYPQIFKIYAHQAKYLNNIEENSLIKIFDKYEQKTANADFPLKRVFHSALAEMYYWYYQQNRWRFAERSQTKNFELENLETWDLVTIQNKIIAHYDSSLLTKERLQRVNINYFDAILLEQTTNKHVLFDSLLRPTLYDLLAHRALDFYISGESNVLNPAQKFNFEKEDFLPYKNFISRNFQISKNVSAEIKALKILKDLLSFHSSNNNLEAVVNVDLKRLSFVAANYTKPDRDSLHFNALQKLEAETHDIPINAEVNFEIAQIYFNKASEIIDTDRKVASEHLVKAKRILTNTVKEFPNSFGAKNSISLLKSIEQNELGFETQHVYPSNQKILMHINYKNVDTSFIKIVKSPFREFESYNIDQKQRITSLKEQKSIYSDIILLDNSIPYVTHTTELVIPKLEVGHYVILVSSNRNFELDSSSVSYQDIWISDLAYISKNNTEFIDFYAVDRTRGKFLKDIEVQVWIQEYRSSTRNYHYLKKATNKTNSEGYAKIDYSNKSNNYLFLLINGKDSLLSGDYYHTYHTPSNVRKRKVSQFFLDRAIYRPGQTVHFKNIIIETDGENPELLNNYASSVSLFNVNGKEVDKLELKTNEFGSIGGSFTLPNSGLGGRYRIADKHGSVYFLVEEYKRPTFRVTIDSLTDSYSLNEKIEISGKAATYAGSSTSNSTIKYRVTRETHYPYPYFFRSSFPRSEKVEIASGETISDENGNFNFFFNALADPKIDSSLHPIFHYNITIDVTDINGETQSNSTSIAVGYHSFILTTDIEDKILKDSSSTKSLIATNLMGKEIEVQGNYSIQKLVPPERIFKPQLLGEVDIHSIDSIEFVIIFPHLAYNGEDKIQNWQRGKKVLESSFSTSQNNKISHNNLEKGAYILNAEAMDNNGEKVVLEKYFVVYSKNDKSIPVPEFAWFTPIKTEVEAGEKAEFLIGTKAKNVTVLYEVEFNKQVVFKEKINLDNEMKLISFPTQEKHRGGFTVHLAFVKENRLFNFSQFYNIPYSNKKLDINVSTYRDHLQPGEKDEWRLTIKDHKGDKIVGELLASMYDASLDQFTDHTWNFDLYRPKTSTTGWRAGNTFSVALADRYSPNNHQYFYPTRRIYPAINWFGFHIGYGNMYYDGIQMERSMQMTAESKVANQSSNDTSLKLEEENIEENEEGVKEEVKTTSAVIYVRKNFNETAFFFPHVKLNESGDYMLTFTMPDALTEWKFKALAHTKDLKIGKTEKTVVTSKDLMVFPNMPRFFRIGDQLKISARVSNLSSKNLNGEVELHFYNAFTGTEIEMNVTSKTKPFTLNANDNLALEWDVKVPENFNAITYKIVATSNGFSDGEENTIPVLPNRMLVTESMPLTIRGNETKTFSFDKLASSSKSKTLKTEQITLEFSSNPSWYAVQALPYLMENSYDCSEQVFSRYFANSLASFIANSNPAIQDVFDYWKNIQPDALLSNLEKNQDLKSILIEETPWLRDAENETERKKRIAVLFDLNRMSAEKENSLQKLKEFQLPNGGWPWFANGPDDRYITQYIVSGFGHLAKLGAESKGDSHFLEKAVLYLDERMREDFDELQRKNSSIDSNQIAAIQIHYLYTRSFFPEIAIAKENQAAYNYYLKSCNRNWLKQSLYSKAMTALIMYRSGNVNTAMEILNSIRENSIQSDEMGMYWKSNTPGYYWNQAPIETQSLLIEAFEEINDETKSVEEMKIWLLKQKQTQNWKSTKATALACYALLRTGKELMTNKNEVILNIGDYTIDIDEQEALEAGTGYIKRTWTSEKVSPDMSEIKITKNSDGIAWGAVYWQYFEDLDKIESAETPLKLTKELFIEKNSSNGSIISPLTSTEKAKVGDKVIVRIILQVDRRMEYLHMKDMRASGLEPLNVISSYQYQDGLSYYQSTKDASTNFFFSNLNKGTYVFEYALRASIAGKFSNGITSIQSMYAPEFSSHSKGETIEISR